MAAAVIEVHNLRKFYGKLEAVRGVSFEIAAGTIFGLLGPNGAGKTSTIEMIEGLRVPDGGTIRVAGLRPIEDAMQVRQVIGAQLQTTSLPDKLKVREAFELFASFYQRPAKISDLVAWVGLTEKKETFFQYLSGGEKQRVALGLALVGNPSVIFLDEPTTGLDAKIRRELHELILRLKSEGKCVLLSTHYIEEAERLCDLVGIMDQGRLHAIGHPQELIRNQGPGDRLEAALRDPLDPAILTTLAGVEGAVAAAAANGGGTTYYLRGRNGGKMLASLAVYADHNGNELLEAKIAHTSLEDVYLSLTGRKIGDE